MSGCRASFTSAIAVAALCASCAGTRPLLPAAGLPSPRNEVVFLGDSLTAGYGLDPAEAFPDVIGAYWAAQSVSLSAMNAGVPGDTTADVLARLDGAVSPRTCLVFLAIGSNDAFRGVDPATTAANITQIVRKLASRGVNVAIAEITLPPLPTFSTDYRTQFEAIYRDAGARLRVPVMPRFFAGVSESRSYWQSDGLHPNAAGARVLAGRILLFLNPDWKLPAESTS